MDTKKCTLLRLDCLACGLGRVLGMIFLTKPDKESKSYHRFDN